MGLNMRSFNFLEYGMFRILYTTFVRPHIEYAQSVWSPHLAKYVNILENVQVRATKLVDGMKGLDYADRLRKLNIPTLQHRRLRGDMIQVWKHIHSYDKLTLPKSFEQNPRPSRKHGFQLVWKITKKMAFEVSRPIRSTTERQRRGITSQSPS